MANFFISYARKDIETARKLTSRFNRQGLDFWIDWEGIPPTVDWWREIEKGIEEADIFLFLLSPDSARSKICRQEIEHAAKNGKRLIPVVVRDIKVDECPSELRPLNWIFLRENDDFNFAFGNLITALHTDYAWLQTHRQLQLKALEWDRSKKENSFLLRGKELLDAEFQLATNSSKNPSLTDLQREYIFRSRQTTDRQRRTFSSIAIGGITVMAVLAVLAIIQAGRATRQANIATTAQAIAEKQAIISRAGELAAQSVETRDKNFQVSLLLGVEAFRTLDIEQSRVALRDNSNAHPKLAQYLGAPTDNATCIAFSPDGMILATGSYDKKIILWDVRTRQPISQLTGQTDPVTDVAFSPDGKILASASDENIILWDVAAQRPIGQLTGHTDPVTDLAFSPDGKVIASGGSDNMIFLWDVTSRQPVGQPLAGQAGAVVSLAFSPNGELLASGNSDSPTSRMILWDIASRQPIGELSGYLTDVDVAFSPDGKILASGSYDKKIFLWDVESGQPLDQLIGHADGISSIAFSPDGKIAASGGWDNLIILWDVASRQPIERLSGHLDTVYQVVFSPDGKKLVSDSLDSTILWDLDGHRPVSKRLSQHTDAVKSLAFSQDSKLLASGSDDQTIILWDTVSDMPIIRLSGHTGPVTAVAFSPDGKLLASSSEDHTIRLWDVPSHQAVGQPLMHTATLSSVAFSPSGKILASGSEDATIILWDVDSRQPMDQLIGHTGFVTSVAFNPDGQILASGSTDKTIIFWDLANRQALGEPLRGHAVQVSSVAFSPDGRILASGGFDGTRRWDVATHQPIGQTLIGLGPIDNVAFSPDGKIIASASAISREDQTLVLWDVAASQPVDNLVTGDQVGAFTVAFSMDGETIASSLGDMIVLWDQSPQSWIKRSCQRAGRNLTRAEWAQYFPNDEYRATCSQWPLEMEHEIASAPILPTKSEVTPLVTLTVANHAITNTPTFNTSIGTATNLADLLGKKVISSEADQFRATYTDGPCLELILGSRILSCQSKTHESPFIDLKVSDEGNLVDSTIEGIWIYSSFNGNLPGGLAWNMTKGAIANKLGTPIDTTGSDSKYEIDGSRILWITYDSDTPDAKIVRIYYSVLNSH